MHYSYSMNLNNKLIQKSRLLAKPVTKSCNPKPITSTETPFTKEKQAIADFIAAIPMSPSNQQDWNSIEQAVDRLPEIEFNNPYIIEYEIIRGGVPSLVKSNLLAVATSHGKIRIVQKMLQKLNCPVLKRSAITTTEGRSGYSALMAARTMLNPELIDLFIQYINPGE